MLTYGMGTMLALGVASAGMRKPYNYIRRKFFGGQLERDVKRAEDAMYALSDKFSKILDVQSRVVQL